MVPLKLSTMISEQQIKERVKTLGKQITEEFKGEDIVAICTLKGSYMFYSDLIREIDLNVVCEFFGVSSYHGKTESSGEVKVTLDVTHPLEGKNVLLVEDIVDSGLTMAYLKTCLLARKPKKLKTVSLLVKPAAMKSDVSLDYHGFTIDNEFVVGYGLDYQELYRNLPYIAKADNLN
ncbi:MAG: hypoxanthine phosphoribosyltransferase [Bdellovibrionaceae bacterium]|nr:hypoxanthine phosphoribosyltransferase [Pseudobdellovibrionaceae bacterium]